MPLEFPKIISHRGGMAEAPENSLSAFKNSLAKGCLFVECDVMLSSCGTPVLFHDESLRRISNGKGLLSENSWQELEQLDIGRTFSRKFKGERLMTLEQALSFLSQHNMMVNVELKPFKKNQEELVSQVLSTIMQVWPLERTMPLLSSFDKKSLSLAQSISPDVPRGFLLDKWEEDWYETVESLGCKSVHFNQKCLTAERVAEIKQKGVLLLAYTVNGKRRANQLFSLGVDAIFSDYPELLSQKSSWFNKH